MSYIGSMMESFAHVYRPNIGHDSRRGVTQDPFLPVDLTDGGAAANRLEPDPIPCSVQQASPRTIMLYGQQNAEFSTVIIFAQDPRCQQNDQVRVTDWNGNVTYYLAIGAAKPIGRAQQWILAANYIEQPMYP